jgi:hypothetical protein
MRRMFSFPPPEIQYEEEVQFLATKKTRRRFSFSPPG